MFKQILPNVMSPIIVSTTGIFKDDAAKITGTETKPQAITRLQAGDFTDLSLLKHSFGAPVPYWAQTPFEGESRNREHAGENVRCVEMRFENGCRVQAVMPETAASLLRRQEYMESQSYLSCFFDAKLPKCHPMRNTDF